MRGVDWVRSYWHEGSTWALCLYAAPNPGQVTAYHQLCDLPHLAFHEIPA